MTKRVWANVALVSLGSFALAPVQSLYDAYMPKFLTQFIASSLLIGLVMALDNVVGILFFPLFGALSDRTRSRWGRRRPFILIGMPLTALGMMALPFGRQLGILPLVLASLMMNFSSTICRPALLAIIPDVTPSRSRPLACGIVLALIGVGNIVSLLAGQRLYAVEPGAPFLFSGSVILVVCLLFLWFLREPAAPQALTGAAETPQQLWAALKAVATSPDRATLCLFSAVLCSYMSMLSVTSWFTIYGEERFGLPITSVSWGLIVFALMVIICAIPAGYLGMRVGRRRTVLWGVAINLVSLLSLFAAQALPLALIGMGGFGMGLMLVLTNIYPMALEICPPNQAGTYTGLYYMCQHAAGILGPPLLGLIFDLAGTRRPLFLIVALFSGTSMILLLHVRTGSTEAPAAHLQPAP